jgi:hypothetical protein
MYIVFLKNILINFERIKYFFIFIFFRCIQIINSYFFYFLVKIYFYDHNKFLIKKIFFIKTKNT